MNNFLILFLCIYVYVEAHPIKFLNGVYKNTNNLDEYYVNRYNNVEGISFNKFNDRENIDFNECNLAENKEACLKQLEIRNRLPDEIIRRLSKVPFIVSRGYKRETLDDNESSFRWNRPFSEDYLDIHDLMRSGEGKVLKQPFIKQKPKSYVIKRNVSHFQTPNKNDRFTYDLTNMRRRNRKKKKQYSDESDSRSSSVSQEVIAKDKRLQTADESQESGSESSDGIRFEKKKNYKKESESGSSDGIRIEKKKNYKKNKDNLMYMQSPTRLYDVRRRLEHFLPKRFHWNEDDIRELRNYWLSGP